MTTHWSPYHSPPPPAAPHMPATTTWSPYKAPAKTAKSSKPATPTWESEMSGAV